MSDRNAGEYWNSLLTEKSWRILQELRINYNFILIGGWAVYLYTKQQKSKDIDIVVGIKELEKLKQDGLAKNDKLKKYEIKKEEIDIDIYVEHYSNLAIPAEEIKNYSTEIEGFNVVRPELLILLKQEAFRNRRDSIKGIKDAIDIISLALLYEIDLNLYARIAEKYGINEFINELKDIVQEFKDFSSLNLKPQELKRRKAEFIGRWKKIKAR